MVGPLSTPISNRIGVQWQEEAEGWVSNPLMKHT